MAIEKQTAALRDAMVRVCCTPLAHSRANSDGHARAARCLPVMHLQPMTVFFLSMAHLQVEPLMRAADLLTKRGQSHTLALSNST